MMTRRLLGQLLLWLTLSRGLCFAQEIYPGSPQQVHIKILDLIMFGYSDFCIPEREFENVFDLYSQNRTMTQAEMLFSEFRNNGQKRILEMEHPYYIKPNDNIHDLTLAKLQEDHDIATINHMFLKPINRSIYFSCDNTRFDLALVNRDYSNQLLALAILRGRISFKTNILADRIGRFPASPISYRCLLEDINYEINMLMRYHNQAEFGIADEDLSAISSQEYARLENDKYFRTFSSYDNYYSWLLTVTFLGNTFNTMGDLDDAPGNSPQREESIVVGSLLVNSPILFSLPFSLERSRRVAEKATVILKQIGEVSPIPFDRNPSIYDLRLYFNTSGNKFSDNFNDGDFTRNPAWNLSPGGTGCWAPGTREVVNGELHIKSMPNLPCGHATMIDYDLNMQVTDQTRVKFDVKPESSDVRYGAGDNQDEYPARIDLELYDSGGNLLRLSFCYNYRGGTSVTQHNYKRVAFPNVPQKTWQRDQSFRIKDYFPNAVRMGKIYVGGNGWDYEAYFDNISVE